MTMKTLLCALVLESALLVLPTGATAAPAPTGGAQTFTQPLHYSACSDDPFVVCTTFQGVFHTTVTPSGYQVAVENYKQESTLSGVPCSSSSLRDQRSHFLVAGAEFREQFQRLLTEDVVTCPGLPTVTCTSTFFFQLVDGRLVFGRAESACTRT
jgi:hypothetical protein